MIVPERIGNFSTIKIAKEVLFLIKNRDQLKTISDNLHKERGDKGAAKKLASMIVNSIKKLAIEENISEKNWVITTKVLPKGDFDFLKNNFLEVSVF